MHFNVVNQLNYENIACTMMVERERDRHIIAIEIEHLGVLLGLNAYNDKKNRFLLRI